MRKGIPRGSTAANSTAETAAVACKMKKMTIWEEGSPQGSLALNSRSITPCVVPDWGHWADGLLSASDGWRINRVRAGFAVEIQG